MGSDREDAGAPMIIWLIVGAAAVLFLRSRGASADWRADRIEKAACQILVIDKQTPDALELQWMLARSAYPEMIWPTLPGDHLPVTTSEPQRYVWARLGEFARGALDPSIGVNCG